jgi:hypothetical protein
MAARIIAVIFFVISVSGCDKFRVFLAAESWKWSVSGVAETKRRGDIVCRAVDAYRTKNGEYPPELKKLQPSFIREIPQPTVGHKQWWYVVIDNGTNYNLKVVGSEFGPILERTNDGKWDYIK